MLRSLQSLQKTTCSFSLLSYSGWTKTVIRKEGNHIRIRLKIYQEANTIRKQMEVLLKHLERLRYNHYLTWSAEANLPQRSNSQITHPTAKRSNNTQCNQWASPPLHSAEYIRLASSAVSADEGSIRTNITITNVGARSLDVVRTVRRHECTIDASGNIHSWSNWQSQTRRCKVPSPFCIGSWKGNLTHQKQDSCWRNTIRHGISPTCGGKFVRKAHQSWVCVYTRLFCSKLQVVHTLSVSCIRYFRRDPDLRLIEIWSLSRGRFLGTTTSILGRSATVFGGIGEDTLVGMILEGALAFGFMIEA